MKMGNQVTSGYAARRRPDGYNDDYAAETAFPNDINDEEKRCVRLACSFMRAAAYAVKDVPPAENCSVRRQRTGLRSGGL